MQDHYNLIYREEERDAAAVPSGGRGGDPVEPAGARSPDPSVGETTARLVSDEVGKISTTEQKPAMR
jgi:hypothetical protein